MDYAYDPHGLQGQVMDARNGATTYGYHPSADVVTSVTTPHPGTLGGAPQTTVTHYNKMLQATNVVQPDGTSVSSAFYPNGLPKRQHGSRTYPVGYSYDYAGRLKTMTNWSAFPNTGARVTTWNYHSQRGWLESKQYPVNDTGAPEGDGPTYTYTDAGRLKSRSWARGVVTWYTNTAAGELERVWYSDGTPGVTNSYDRRGRQKQITTQDPGLGTWHCYLAYNDAGQLLSEAYSGGLLNGLAVTNAYDAYLRRSAVGLNTQPSTLNRFGYDNAGRLAGVTNGSSVAAYGYLANSPLVANITFKQSGTTRMTTTKQYDLLNRLTQISSQPSGTGVPPVSFGYSYNSANQRTRATLADGSYWLYEYDALGQVKSGKKYWYDGTPVAGQQFEYGFDDIGNRTQTEAGGDENGWNLREASYTANALNQYTNRTVPGAVDVMGIALATANVTVNSQSPYRRGEYFRKELSVSNGSGPVWQGVTVEATGQDPVTGNVLVPGTPEASTYDADGNLTSDSLWTNLWNAENRLAVTESRAAVATTAKRRVAWSYLPDGRWIERVVSTNNGTSYFPAFTNRYVWDGKVLLAVLDHTNGLVMSFVRGLDLSGTMQGAGGVGGVLAVTFKNEGTHFAAYDGNGNVTALVSGADGGETARYEYGPFAEPLRQTGPVAKLNPIRFSTQYADDVTGSVKYLYRDYRADLGRWLSRDPIGEAGARNVYVFVNNAAIRKTDFLGLWVIYDALKDRSGFLNKYKLVSFLGLPFPSELDEIAKIIVGEVVEPFSPIDLAFHLGSFRFEKPLGNRIRSCVIVNIEIRRDLPSGGLWAIGAGGTLTIQDCCNYKFGDVETKGVINLNARLGPGKDGLGEGGVFTDIQLRLVKSAIGEPEEI